MQETMVKSELDKVLNGAMTNSSADVQQAMNVVIAGAPTVLEQAAPVSAPSATQNSLADAIAQNTAQLTQVRTSIDGQLDSISENTRALADNTSSKLSGVGSAVSSVAGSMANNVLGGGLLAPIVSGLMGLFGGKDKNAAPEPLVKFALPQSVSVNTGVQGSSSGSVDYGQGDQPRIAAPTQTPQPQPQITVNVSAMDSRSFLDHSQDIANAVRRAMLESSSLNDVIGEM